MNEFWSNLAKNCSARVLQEAGLTTLDGIDLCQDLDGFFYCPENWLQLSTQFATMLEKASIFQNHSFKVDVKKSDRTYWAFTVTKRKSDVAFDEELDEQLEVLVVKVYNKPA